MFGGGPCPSLYIRRDRVTWKVLAEYSWSPTTTQSDSFLCTAASSMPIRVVTKEVRYIHKLSLTLEYSMPISSPVAPGLIAAVHELENLGLLQTQGVIQWRAGEGEDYPMESTLETIVFRDFVERGLALPVSEFLYALLQFWGIQLH